MEVDVAEVTDEDVEEQLESLRERFGSLTTVERSAGEGDFVVIDLAATADGEPIEDAQATGLTYEVGAGNVVEGSTTRSPASRRGSRPPSTPRFWASTPVSRCSATSPSPR